MHNCRPFICRPHPLSKGIFIGSSYLHTRELSAVAQIWGDLAREIYVCHSGGFRSSTRSTKPCTLHRSSEKIQVSLNYSRAYQINPQNSSERSHRVSKEPLPNSRFFERALLSLWLKKLKGCARISRPSLCPVTREQSEKTLQHRSISSVTFDGPGTLQCSECSVCCSST
jgi:hypothetical protein